MSNPSTPSLPKQPPFDSTTIPAGPSQSVWDMITTWASEHKAVVYTVAGITLVATAAGVFYYVNTAPKSESSVDEAAAAAKRKARKDKRKAKKEPEDKSAEESTGQSISLKEADIANLAWTGKPNQATVSSVDEDELPEITEQFVAGLTDEVNVIISRVLRTWADHFASNGKSMLLS